MSYAPTDAGISPDPRKSADRAWYSEGLYHDMRYYFDIWMIISYHIYLYTVYIHIFPDRNERFSKVIRVITPSTGLGNIQKSLVWTHSHPFGQDLGPIRPAAAEVLRRPELHGRAGILRSGMSRKLIWNPKVSPRFASVNGMHVPPCCQVRAALLGDGKRDAGWVQCPDLRWHRWLFASQWMSLPIRWWMEGAIKGTCQGYSYSQQICPISWGAIRNYEKSFPSI